MDYCTQATSDLEDLDKERKQEFKTYEMEKEHLRREKLKQLDEEDRAAKEKEFQELREKHMKHAKVNHPVSLWTFERMTSGRAV